jgi:hypothetical protein
LIKPILQHDGSRGRVQTVFPLSPVSLAERQSLFSFSAREALVLQIDRQPGPFRKSGSQLQHASGQVVIGPIEATGQSHDDSFNRVVVSEMVERVHNECDGIDPRVASINRSNRACKRPRPIADGQSDSTLSEINTKDAHSAS